MNSGHFTFYGEITELFLEISRIYTTLLQHFNSYQRIERTYTRNVP